MGIVRLRRALDHIIRSVAVHSDLSPGTKPLDKIIDDLAHKSILPAVICKHCRVVKDFGNIAAHGNSVASYTDEDKDLSMVEAKMCATSMEIIARWYFERITPQLPEDNPYVVVSGEMISKEMIHQAVQIDALIYPEKFRGMFEICCSWFEKNPHIYIMIIDGSTHNVIGYVNAMPLEAEYYARIASGSTIDIDIPSSVIRKYDLPDFYLLYFASICLHPSYQNTSAFRALYDAFIEKLVQLARNDIFMTEILADAVTPEGVRLCRYAGMHEERQTEHKSTIYKVSLLPPALRVTTKTGKNLLGFYKRKYEEFKDLL